MLSKDGMKQRQQQSSQVTTLRLIKSIIAEFENCPTWQLLGWTSISAGDNKFLGYLTRIRRE
jgi:hypothetical protein